MAFVRRRSTTSRRSRGSRLPGHWQWAREEFSSLVLTGTAAPVVATPLGNLETAAGDRISGTIYRIRGYLSVARADALADNSFFTMGLKIDSQDLVATHPDPRVTSDDRFSSWMGYWSLPLHGPAGGTATETQQTWMLPIDIKAKRKFRSLDERLYLSYAHTGLVGDVARVGISLSILVRLDD